MATIGERIKEKRKALGLTQEGLAEKVGVTFQAVSKWENNTSMPDIGLINALASALDMGVDELMNGSPCHETEKPRAVWGKIIGTITKDIHADVGKIIGDVQADIYGNVNGDIVGSVNNIFGNVEGNVTGTVNGDITGYVKGNLRGDVMGSVKLGVRGKVLGTIVGDGINVDMENK